MKKIRSSNLELLRLLAMLSIVLGHLVNHGNLLYSTPGGSIDYYLCWILFSFLFQAINIFILISGYFLVDGRFSTWKLARLAGQTFFYSLGITLIFWIFGGVPRELKYMVFSLLPITSDFYWFISMYAGMYLLSPLLNRLVRSLTRNQLKCACLLGFALCSVWPTVAYFSSALNTAGGVSIAWFVVVYMMGAYLKLYYVPDGKWKKKMLLSVVLLLCLPLSRFVIELVLRTPLGNIPFFDDLMWGYSLFYNYSSVLVVITSLTVFVTFLNLKITSPRLGKVINLFAGTAFGVYLIHDHYYIREWLWKKLAAGSWIGHWYLLPMCILTTLGLYLAGSCIELLRQKLFGLWEKEGPVKQMFITLDDKLKVRWHKD